MESSTTTGQRIVIWAIIILMTLSTVALYVGVVLTQQNTQTEQARLTSLESDFSTKLNEHDEKVQARVATEVTPEIEKLSNQYYPEFSEYEKYPSAFNSSSIEELKTKDLKEGSGEEITEEFSDYSMYYVGWQPDGEIFDSSFDGDSLLSPLPGAGSYIEGWTQGVIGMKVGGIREISMPSAQAYGEQGSGTEGSAGYIAPNTPLKFVVMAIQKPTFKTEEDISAEIPYPKGTFDLCKELYVEMYGEELIDMVCASYSNEEE